MPGTTAAIVAINANSSAAASRAHQAQVTACQALSKDFRGDTATIEQRQTYADCVQVLYPRELGPESVFVIKALIVAAIIGAVVGAWRGTTHDWLNKAEGFVLYGLMGAIAGPFAVICVAGLRYGVQYLAT